MDKKVKTMELLLKWEWNVNTIIAVSLAGVMALTFLCFFIVERIKKSSNRKQLENIKLNSSNVTVYIYNVKDSTIRFFSKQAIGKQRVLTYDAFFDDFTDHEEAISVKKWITVFASSGKSEGPILTVKSHIPNSKKECFSIYRITFSDMKKQIVHFEKYLLPEVSEKHVRHKQMAYSMEEIANYVKSGKKVRFVSFYIKLIPYLSIPDKMNTSTTTSSLYATSILQPLNEIQKYLSPKRRLVLVDDSSAVIFDFTLMHRADIISFCNLLISEIQRYFSISALSNLYDIAIGCAYYDSNEIFGDVVKKSEELALKAGSRENVRFLIEGDAEAEGSYASFSSEEINSLIANSTYRIYFTPVIKEDDKEQIFMTDVKPYGIAQTSFYDLAIAADRYNLLVPLLDSVFKSIEDSLSDIDLQSFVLVLPFSKSTKVLEAIDKFPKISSKLIVCFDKVEIHDFYEADVNLDRVFVSLKKKIKLGLNFSDSSVDSPSELLNHFDLFLVSLGEGNPLYMEERKKAQLISDFSILHSYNKPIIISGIQTKSDLKLGYELGFTSFVSDKLAGPSSCPYIPNIVLDDSKDDEEEEVNLEQVGKKKAPGRASYLK
jgi:hypothetical protein